MADALRRRRPGGCGPREIRLNKRNFVVSVGIAPHEGFQAIRSGAGLSICTCPSVLREAVYGSSAALTERDSHWLDGYARLSPGGSRQQTEQELNAISAHLRKEFARDDDYSRAELIPVWQEGGGHLLAPVIMLMMGVVAMVLLIACANVANLLLARGAGRRREIAIRHALGVTRGRLIGQLLTENALLALLGCCGAMLLIPASGSMLNYFTPVTDFPVSLSVHPDATVFEFTLAVVGAGDDGFWVAARVAGARMRRCGCRVERRWRRSGGYAAGVVAQLTGGGAGDGFDGPAGGRGIAVEEPFEGGRGGSGIRSAECIGRGRRSVPEWL